MADSAREAVMPGEKREARLRARRPGHPRLVGVVARKAWMAGHRRAAATPSFRTAMPGHDGESSAQTARICDRALARLNSWHDRRRRLRFPPAAPLCPSRYDPPAALAGCAWPAHRDLHRGAWA